MKMSIRRIQVINDTKIKYLLVADKIYEVSAIDFRNMTIEATETDLTIGDVNESELFPVKELLDEYVIGLVNRKDEIDVIDMAEWVKNRKAKRGKGLCKMNMKNKVSP